MIELKDRIHLHMKSRLTNVIKTGDADFAEVVKHAFWAIIVLGGATALQFLFDLLLARSFGAHGTGVFYLCLSVLMVLALIGRLGLDRAVVRFIPGFITDMKPENVLGVSATAVKLSLLLTVPIAVLLFVCAPYLAKEIFELPELIKYLQTFAFAVPPFALSFVYAGVLKAIKRTSASLVIERVGVYSVGILSILTLGALYGVEGVVIGFTIGCYLTAFVGWLLIRNSVHTKKPAVPFGAKKLLAIAAPLLFVAFGTQMNGQASVLILGAASSAADVGIFNVALKVSMLMTLILTAVNTIAATKIAELYSSGRKEELSILISKITALGTVCALPLASLLIIFPSFLLGLFGQEFVSGSMALVILTIGQFINVAAGSTMFVLAMTDNQKSLAKTVAFSLVLNIVLGIILIPIYGVEGASIVTASTIAVSNIIMIFQVRKHLGIWQLPFKAIGSWIKTIRTS